MNEPRNNILDAVRRIRLNAELSAISNPFAEAFNCLAPPSSALPPEHEAYLMALMRTARYSPPTEPHLSSVQVLSSNLDVKPRIFVSYHHGADRQYYDEFSRRFADSYDVCDDNSVARVIDSDNCEYVMRRIRERYLTGSSCTLVLCGAQTRWRKFVDWEIKATLDKQHGLIGVNLPTNPRDIVGRVHKP